MARPSVLPPMSELEKMLDAGMTHQQIAERISRDTMTPVARSTVSVALARAGRSAPQSRYTDTVPWTVKVEHSSAYALRMLRALGRRRQGKSLGAEESHRLDAFLERLQREELVVAYCPDDPGSGVHYIDAKYGDSPGIPVRRKPLPLEAIVT